mgnify:CR=1 FL=1
MTITLEKPGYELTPSSIKEKVFETFPSMSRAKKIKLVTQMLPALQLAVTSAELLSLEPLSLPDPTHCDISDDYIILRDEENQPIADVYIGTDAQLSGHVIFDSGEELDSHQRLILQGHELINGYLKHCDCKTCTALKIEATIEHDEKFLCRNSNHVLTVNLPRELKIKDTSDRLLDAMHDSSVDKQNTSIPKITSTNPMKRDGSISYYTNEQ